MHMRTEQPSLSASVLFAGLRNRISTQINKDENISMISFSFSGSVPCGPTICRVAWTDCRLVIFPDTTIPITDQGHHGNNLARWNTQLCWRQILEQKGRQHIFS